MYWALLWDINSIWPKVLGAQYIAKSDKLYFGLTTPTERTSSIKVRVPSEHEHVRIAKVRVSRAPSTPKFDPSERVSEHARCSAHPYLKDISIYIQKFECSCILSSIYFLETEEWKYIKYDIIFQKVTSRRFLLLCLKVHKRGFIFWYLIWCF